MLPNQNGGFVTSHVAGFDMASSRRYVSKSILCTHFPACVKCYLDFLHLNKHAIIYDVFIHTNKGQTFITTFTWDEHQTAPPQICSNLFINKS